MPTEADTGAAPSTRLVRALSPVHVILYGLGVTIGAGIYVLIGATAAKAGVHAPIAFLIAALVMGLSAASFAELVVRFPVSAGEAAYVTAGFRSHRMGLVAGLLVVATGTVSSATISIGAAGYIGVFVPAPEPVIIAAVVLAMTAVAAWGIAESVTLAAVFTLIEIGGLAAVIIAGLWNDPGLPTRLPEILPTSLSPTVWAGIMGAGLLAFFAFIGFEDIVNIAEEASDPERTMPLAIGWTLAISTVLYLSVTSIAVLSVPIAELSSTNAPLALVFERVAHAPASIIAAVAIVATLNGIIVQIIMVARVVYGLSAAGNLPGWLGAVHPVTRTPLVATVLAGAVVMMLALAAPIGALAEWTSLITLTTFTLVNVALVLIKWREREATAIVGRVRLPIAVPVAGAITCLGMLSFGLAAR